MCVCFRVVQLDSSCFLTIHKCYFYYQMGQAARLAEAGVAHGRQGKGLAGKRAMHSHAINAKNVIPSLEEPPITTRAKELNVLKINFSLILLCDVRCDADGDGVGVAMRWPFRVICMPLCSGLAWLWLCLWLLLLLLLLALANSHVHICARCLTV